MKAVIKYIPLFFISLIILIATLSIPKTVHDKTEMQELRLGYPVAFVVQDFTKWDPPFPYKYSFGIPLEHPTKILWLNLTVSYILIFLILQTAITVMNKFRNNKTIDIDKKS